ncbi:MAG: hypothetical protein ACR2JF_03800 [Iamia sp.]
MTPGAPLVGLTHGPVWARAEPSTPGVDLGHGGLNVVVRAGTVLLDAQGGAGLMIVMRGEVEITMSGQEPRIARAGEALSFDGSGAISEPDPVDAAELARDPFVSLNLVLDALGGVPVTVPDPAPAEPVDEGADDAPAPDEPPEPGPRKGWLFAGRRK